MAGDTTMVMLDAKGNGLGARFSGEGRFRMGLGELTLKAARLGEAARVRRMVREDMRS
jgi:hypothetical protein